MDVINAAKMISECGSKLNKLAREIAAQVNLEAKKLKISLAKNKSIFSFIFSFL